MALQINHSGINIHNHYDGVLTPEELLHVTGYEENYVRVLKYLWNKFKDEGILGYLLKSLLSSEHKYFFFLPQRQGVHRERYRHLWFDELCVTTN